MKPPILKLGFRTYPIQALTSELALNSHLNSDLSSDDPLTFNLAPNSNPLTRRRLELPTGTSTERELQRQPREREREQLNQSDSAVREAREWAADQSERVNEGREESDEGGEGFCVYVISFIFYVFYCNLYLFLITRWTLKRKERGREILPR